MWIIRESEDTVAFSIPIWIRVQWIALFALFLASGYYLITTTSTRGAIYKATLALIVVGIGLYNLLRAFETVEVQVHQELAQVIIRKGLLGYWYSTRNIDTATIKTTAIMRRARYSVPGIMIVLENKKSVQIKTEDEKSAQILYSKFNALPAQKLEITLPIDSPITYEKTEVKNGSVVGKVKEQGKVIHFDKERGYEIELEDGKTVWLSPDQTEDRKIVRVSPNASAQNEFSETPKRTQTTTKISWQSGELAKAKENQQTLPKGSHIDLTFRKNHESGSQKQISGTVIKFDKDRGYEIELDSPVLGDMIWLPADKRDWPQSIGDLTNKYFKDDVNIQQV